MKLNNIRRYITSAIIIGCSVLNIGCNNQQIENINAASINGVTRVNELGVMKHITKNEAPKYLDVTDDILEKYKNKKN